MIDVNETRYHLLLGREDWIDRCRAEDGIRHWEYVDHRQVIRLQAEIFTFAQQGPAVVPLTANDFRGAARDSYGHFYWIGQDDAQIMALWAAASGPELMHPAQEEACPPEVHGGVFRPVSKDEVREPEPLAGLAVGDEGYLVAGSPSTGSLLLFDLYALDGGFIRVPLPPPPATPADLTQPYDLVALPGGGLLVMDRVHKLVWRLDATFRPAPETNAVPGSLMDFQPKKGRPHRRQVAPTAEPIDLSSTGDPVAIEALPDGSFWVLDNGSEAGASRLWRFSPDNEFSPQQVELVTANLVDEGDDDLDLLQIRGHDLAHVGGGVNEGGELLFVVDVSGNQAYALRADLSDGLSLRIDRQYFPLRSYTGTALVAVGSEGEAYYHQGSRWLPIKPLPQMRYEEEATLLGPVFDGREPGCVWHRLCVDACIPPHSGLMVETRAADNQDELSWQAWQLQPTLYQRPSGSEIPYSDYWGEDELGRPDTGTWELLFQQTQGRYMQLRLTLSGNVRTTPTVRALRAYYPRFSYLKAYLPAVFQQDPVTSSFLERFLANPEGVFSKAEGLVAQAQFLLDVRTVPVEAVEWLSSWLGLMLEPGWTEYQRRLLVAHASYFFQRRGTLPGLMQAILLTVLPEMGPDIFRDDIDQFCTTIRIVERFLTRRHAGVVAGDPTEQEISAGEDGRAHAFTVMLPTTIDQTTIRLVERIVELEKPAHTSFKLKQYWALFRVGEVRLGLDTVLGQGGRFETFRLGQTGLAEGILGAAFPYNLTSRNVIAR